MQTVRVQDPRRAGPLTCEAKKAADETACLPPLLTVNNGLEEMRECAQFRRLPLRIRAEVRNAPDVFVTFVADQVFFTGCRRQRPKDSTDYLGLDGLAETNYSGRPLKLGARFQLCSDMLSSRDKAQRLTG